MTTFYKKYF